MAEVTALPIEAVLSTLMGVIIATIAATIRPEDVRILCKRIVARLNPV